VKRQLVTEEGWDCFETMGMHHTRPTLPQDVLEKVQNAATSAVTSCPKLSAHCLKTFYVEASRWMHTGRLQEVKPWQHFALLYMEDCDRVAMAATSCQAWQAFFRPKFTYVVCRGALAAWPEIWGDAWPEMRQALMEIDETGLNGSVDGLTIAVGALAWAMVSSSAKSQIAKELKEDILRECYSPSFANRLVHGIPSQREQAKELFQQACQFLQQAVFAAGQHRANSVIWTTQTAPSMGTVCQALRVAPRPRLAKPLPNQRGMRSRVIARQSWHVCGCMQYGLPHDDSEPEECTDTEVEVVLAASDSTHHDVQWHTTLDTSHRSFHRLRDHDQKSGLIERAVKGLIEEFESLWRCRRDNFLTWQEDDRPTVGWKLFGTHLFGYRLEMNCTAAPIATSLAEALGATMCGFSVLLPGTHIEPHAEDSKSASTRVHVGLHVPHSGCGLRVGAQVRVWQAGGVLIFNSARDHEAWNFSTEIRAVLLLDFGAQPLHPSAWPRWLQQRFPTLGKVEA